MGGERERERERERELDKGSVWIELDEGSG